MWLARPGEICSIYTLGALGLNNERKSGRNKERKNEQIIVGERKNKNGEKEGKKK
jgi:hypothetical protein